MLGTHHDVETCTLATANADLKVQFAMWRHGWRDAIETTQAPVLLRYSDLPESAELTVPTASGFAAMKLLAWLDRAAPRDIYDLAALAEADMIDREALQAVHAIIGHTPTSQSVTNVAMSSVRKYWSIELEHQLDNPRSLDRCVEMVRDALDSIAYR